MVKKHLKNVIRKPNIEDKTKFDFILSQNERNLELPKELFKKFIDSIKFSDLAFYPNLNTLKSKIKKYSGCSNIILTPGSDIAIKTIFDIHNLEGKEVLTSEYYFPMYKVYTDIANAKLKTTDYNSDRLKIEDLINNINVNTKLILLANPNSPVGDTYTLKDIELLLEKGIPTVIDEAYIEISNATSAIPLLKKYKNLFITRTFSKGFGAAGCRVGYICSNKENIQILEKLRFMYEVSAIGGKYCEFILDNIKYFKSYTKELLSAKSKYIKYLEQKKFFTIYDTNSSWFFLLKTAESDEFIADKKISIKEVDLKFLGEGRWYKFNFDLKLISK